MEQPRESVANSAYANARLKDHKKVLWSLGLALGKVASIYKLSALDEPAQYQLVGRVMAYQGYDV